METLYPLTFKTIFKEKIWGGSKIKSILGKDYSPLKNCGETWEISGVPGNISEVDKGALAGKKLTQLLEDYKGKLVGNKVYARFGNTFPLLIKFLDANDDLSIQVHPDDTLAMERHQSFGKTEMWYILQADDGAKLNTGFNRTIDEATYLAHLNSGKINEILNFEDAREGDVFYLPAGRVHYIGKGICLAEIQQSSDITYRIYDFDRKDDQGNLRELHTDQALGALDYQFHKDYKTNYRKNSNEQVSLVNSPYFQTNLYELDKQIQRDYYALDSFIIFIGLDGKTEIEVDEINYTIEKGECIFIPAVINKLKLNPAIKSKLLEVYIP